MIVKIILLSLLIMAALFSYMIYKDGSNGLLEAKDIGKQIGAIAGFVVILICVVTAYIYYEKNPEKALAFEEGLNIKNDSNDITYALISEDLNKDYEDIIFDSKEDPNGTEYMMVTVDSKVYKYYMKYNDKNKVNGIKKRVIVSSGK